MMEIEKAMKLTCEGSDDLLEFSKTILMLTNLKSNGKGIHEIQTLEGTNRIILTVSKEHYKMNESRFDDIVGKVLLAEEIDYYIVNMEDLNSRCLKQFETADNKWYDNDCEGAEPVLKLSEY